jgi:hypothetical protein
MRPGRSRLVPAALAAFLLGVALMIPFESTLTRIGGVIALAAFVVLGVAAIADPRFLAGEGEEDQAERSPSDPTGSGSRSPTSS